MTRSRKVFDESQYEASRGPELLAALTTKMSAARILHAELLDIITELDQNGIVALTGYSKLSHLIADTLRTTPRHAGKLVDQATHVAQRLTPTGHTTPAALPNVRAALLAGLIDGEHIEAIADTIKDIPATADLGARELVEATLAESARTMDPAAVREHGKELLNVLDPDGDEPDEGKPAEPKNSLSYRRDRHGTMTFRGQIDPETAEIFEQMLDKGSTPQPPGKGLVDERSKRERLGDALCDIIDRAANPDGTAARAQLTVHLDLNTLTDAVGTATLESGCHLSPAAVRRLACDAELIPLVLNGDSVPVDVGHSHRLVTKDQRKALVARDRGCAYPGCPNPARWADAHHIVHWKDGGPTDLDNLVLLCRRHHRILHHSAWKVRIANGLPEFIPPQWIDPQQKPLHNTIHLRP